jgi:hypothetical protein
VVRPDGSETRDFLPSGHAGPGHVFLGPLRYVDRLTELEPPAVNWSPDGEWLIGKAFYPDLRLTLIRFATGERLPLNGSTVPFSMPAWKP